MEDGMKSKVTNFMADFHLTIEFNLRVKQMFDDAIVVHRFNDDFDG